MLHGITVRLNPDFAKTLAVPHTPIPKWGIAVKGKAYQEGTQVYLETSRHVPMVARLMKPVAQKKKDEQIWTLYLTTKPVPAPYKEVSYEPEYAACPWTDLESAVQATAVAHTARKAKKLEVPTPVPLLDLLESHVKTLAEQNIVILAQLKELRDRLDLHEKNLILHNGSDRRRVQ